MNNERPQVPHEPILRQVFTTDATLEASAALLEQTPRGITCMQDEITGWVLALDPDKGGRGPLAMLEGYGARLALLVQLCRVVCEKAHGDTDGAAGGTRAPLVGNVSGAGVDDAGVTPCQGRGVHHVPEMERLLGHLTNRGLGPIRQRQTSNGMTQTRFVFEPLT